MELTFTKLSQDVNVDEFDIDNGLIKQNIRDSYFNQVKNISCTKSIALDGKIIGFYEIMALSVKDPFDSECDDKYFVVFLKYIFIVPEHRNRGFGSLAIKNIIRETRRFCDFIGIRFLIIHALNEYVEWYENRGFLCIKKFENHTDMCFDFRDTDKYNSFLD